MKNFVGKLVITNHDIFGSYIGILEEISESKALVRILYVLEYPIQHIGVERKPFQYYRNEEFSPKHLAVYSSDKLSIPYKISEIEDFTLALYKESILISISNAIRDIENYSKVLIEHEYECLKCLTH